MPFHRSGALMPAVATCPLLFVERSAFLKPSKKILVDVASKPEVVAFPKFWVAVHQLALPRLRPMVCAAEPLYEPENESEPLVAERLKRFWPRATLLIVEYWSWLLPIVEVETNEVPLYARSWPEV